MRAEIAVKLHVAVGGKQGHRAALEQAFHASDADGDGSVDFAEFCSTAAAIGLGVSEPQLQAAFNKFDRDGSNAIEFQEVINVKTSIQFLLLPPCRVHPFFLC
jgi:Ca2+-binding EF-hand superfamily protein